MTDETDADEQMVEDGMDDPASPAMLSKMNDDETVTRGLSWRVCTYHDSEGFAMSALHDLPATEWNDLLDWLEENVEPLLDRRKLPSEGMEMVPLGSLTFDGTGELVDAEIDSEYRKPTAQDTEVWDRE